MIQNQDKGDWDARLAASFIGRTLLVGITTVNAQEEVIDELQLYGRIESADPREGIGLRLLMEEGQGDDPGSPSPLFMLPPDLATIQPAMEGSYTMYSNGRRIDNPEFLAFWTRIKD